MNTTTLRDVTGRILGTITRNPNTKVQTARTNMGGVVGTYNEQRDGTWNNMGSYVGSGNMLPILLFQAK